MTRYNESDRRERERRPAQTSQRIREELLKISNRERKQAERSDLERARKNLGEARERRLGIGGPAAIGRPSGSGELPPGWRRDPQTGRPVNTTAPSPGRGGKITPLPPMSPGVDPGAPR